MAYPLVAQSMNVRQFTPTSTAQNSPTHKYREMESMTLLSLGMSRAASAPITTLDGQKKAVTMANLIRKTAGQSFQTDSKRSYSVLQTVENHRKAKLVEQQNSRRNELDKERAEVLKNFPESPKDGSYRISDAVPVEIKAELLAIRVLLKKYPNDQFLTKWKESALEKNAKYENDSLKFFATMFLEKHAEKASTRANL